MGKNDKIKKVTDQLALYLNRENNQKLFSVLEYILNSSDGVTYSQISKKFKIDIINASHYCCRLKKMKFISWDQGKDGVTVFPFGQSKQKQDKDKKDRQEEILQQEEIDKKVSPFCFSELSFLQNIWINVSSAESYLSQAGISN